MKRLSSCRLFHAARLALFALVSLATPQASHAQSAGNSCTDTSCGDTSCGQFGQPPCSSTTQEFMDTGSPSGCDRGLKPQLGSDGASVSCVNGTRELAPVDGWIANSLRLQRELQADLPLNRLAVLGAHNAFNNASDGYILWNQFFSITDQLNMGIRKISLDVHWFNNALRLCHRDPDANLGNCSTLDRPFYQAIEELNQWMRRPENSQEVVFIDLELYLDGHPAELIAPIKRHLEDLVLRRSDVPSLVDPSAPLPTLNTIRQLGRRLIIMEASGLDGLGGGELDLFIPLKSENGYPSAKIKYFGDYPLTGGPCSYWRVQKLADLVEVKTERVLFDPTYSNTTKYIDFYEDTLFIVGPLDVGLIFPWTLEQLTDCHVTHIALDQVTSEKLEPAVWSWNYNQPDDGNGEDCAEMMETGRWNDRNCGAIQRFACRRIGDRVESGSWRVTTTAGPWQQGASQCELEYGINYRFDVPRTGYENQFLFAAAQGQKVWLNLTDSVDEGVWKSPNTEPRVVEFKALGKCLDLANSNTADGTNILLWDCHGRNNQKWLLLGDGTIRSAIDSSKCLDLANSNTANGTRVLLWNCHGGNNQKWIVDGPFVRSALNRNKVLDVYGGNTANGTPIEIWDYNGGANQQWVQVPK